jgi:hypothetical protein
VQAIDPAAEYAYRSCWTPAGRWISVALVHLPFDSTAIISGDPPPCLAA